MKRPAALTLLALTALGGMGLSQATRPIIATPVQAQANSLSSMQPTGAFQYTMAPIPTILAHAHFGDPPMLGMFGEPGFVTSASQQAYFGGLARLSNEMFNGPAGPQIHR